MARLAKFDHAQILDATARLASRSGPAQVTMARIAEAIGAPTGSIYHRFASRDVLLAEVWLRTAQAFQDEFGERLAGDAAWQAGLDAALFVPARVRRKPDEARLLLLHRRSDFLASGWPAEMVERAAQLERQADGALRSFCKRLLQRSDADTRRMVRFALVDAPMAAVLPHLRAQESPPPLVDLLIRTTYEAVLQRAGAKGPAHPQPRAKGDPR
jgi:AcrR family transcriptional regulator